MKLIDTLGNMPVPVAVLFLTEANASRAVAAHPTEGIENPPVDFYPIVVECKDAAELDQCTISDPDVDKQLLVDKKTGRLYITAIGWPGRIRIVGSGEEDERVIDLIQKTEDRSIIYYAEVHRGVPPKTKV